MFWAREIDPKPPRKTPQKTTSKEVTKESEVTWLPDLYTFDNNGKVRIFIAGYSKGAYHSGSGLVYLKDGSPSKIAPHDRKIPMNRNSSSLTRLAIRLSTLCQL